MPKVVIRKSTNPHSWYFNEIGNAFDLVDVEPQHYQVRLGGKILRQDAELIYSEAEYRKLHATNKALYEELESTRHALNRAVDDIAAYVKTLVKVTVPKDVAEAIESFRAEGHDIDYIMKNLTRDSNGLGIPSSRVRTLRNYSYRNGGTLIQALVNGYSVEQSPEEKLQQEIEDLIQEWWFSPMTTDKDVAMAAKELAGKIVEHAKQFT